MNLFSIFIFALIVFYYMIYFYPFRPLFGKRNSISVWLYWLFFSMLLLVLSGLTALRIDSIPTVNSVYIFDVLEDELSDFISDLYSGSVFLMASFAILLIVCGFYNVFSMKNNSAENETKKSDK